MSSGSGLGTNTLKVGRWLLWAIGVVLALYLVTIALPSLATKTSGLGAWLSSKGIKQPTPLFWSLGAVLFYLSLAGLVAGRINPMTAIVGADGRLSASKFQFFVWTGVTLFVFVWIVAQRFTLGVDAVIPSIPKNVMMAMGFSIVTLAASKGITVSYVNSGRVAKEQAPADDATKLAGLVAKDDLETPDLVKIQMLVWTVVAVVIYLVRAAGHLDDYAACTNELTGTCFPDIDGVLMVLMGLGQGAYLGGKLTTADTPAITAASTRVVLPGQEVTLSGTLFGATQGRSVLSFGKVQIAPRIWSESSIVFEVPLTSDGQTRWTNDESTTLTAIVDGTRIDGDATFVVAFPDVKAVGVPIAAQSSIVIEGGPFGVPNARATATIGPFAVSSTDANVTWTNDRISITDARFRGGPHLVTVTVNGYAGTPGHVQFNP